MGDLGESPLPIASTMDISTSATRECGLSGLADAVNSAVAGGFRPGHEAEHCALDSDDNCESGNICRYDWPSFAGVTPDHRDRNCDLPSRSSSPLVNPPNEHSGNRSLSAPLQSSNSKNPGQQSCEHPTGLGLLNPNVTSREAEENSGNYSNTPMMRQGHSESFWVPGVTDLSSHSSGRQSAEILKVEDALNYLDQVKCAFVTQPDVYNAFLDIMKGFKSRSIDTPGVVARVSHLFRGRSELTVGFNTFLPQGYKIELKPNNQISLSVNVQGGGCVVTTVEPEIVPGSPDWVYPTPQPQPPNKTRQHNAPESITTKPLPSYANNPTHPTGFGKDLGIDDKTSCSAPAPPSGSSSLEKKTVSEFNHSFSSPFNPVALTSIPHLPEEFNHAVNYVGKIKNRYSAQPEIYFEFLDMLDTYQKERQSIRDGLPHSSKYLSDDEVYFQVAKLFENQEDLLEEFVQFLPAYNSNQQDTGIKTAIDEAKNTAELPRKILVPSKDSAFAVPVITEVPKASMQVCPPPPTRVATATKKNAVKMKKPALPLTLLPLPTHPKKVKKVKKMYKKLLPVSTPLSIKGISLPEAAKYGTLNDFGFFDKVRQFLKSQDVYDNFLRCLYLYNEDILTRDELRDMVAPFLDPQPILSRWFKKFLGFQDPRDEVISHMAIPPDRNYENKMGIDFSTCKRLGASYCALPETPTQPKCSGRTRLCDKVLNDVWVSFPTWAEDSVAITSKKTQFEENIFKCEDERFELDVIIETNASTIRALEVVANKMAELTEKGTCSGSSFKLNASLGGASPIIHQRAIQRLYGERATDIIELLQNDPFRAVPLVLKRLKAAEDVMRETHKKLTKVWQDQVKRFHLKSLDPRGMPFRQSDIRALRAKPLIKEIETLFDERHNNANEEHSATEPHLSLNYSNRDVLDDACNLLLHHVRRQVSIDKEEKRKIKQLLKHFIPSLFHHPQMELSDDESEESSQDVSECGESSTKFFPDADKNENARKRKRSENTKSCKNGTKKLKLNTQIRTTFGSGALNEINCATEATGGTQKSQNLIQKAEYNIEESSNSEDLSILPQANYNVMETAPEKRICSTPILPVSHNGNVDEEYSLFYANNHWYVLLRLHHVLCERLARMLENAERISNEEAEDRKEEMNSPAITLMFRKPKKEIKAKERYDKFLDLVRDLLDGGFDVNSYEDELRELFGIHAYIAYTMDKIVANIVRQLQFLASHENCHELFQQASKGCGIGGFCATAHQRITAEAAYYKKAEKAFKDNNCVKVVIYNKHCRMNMQLMEPADSDPSPEDDIDEKVKGSAYFQHLANSGEDVSQDMTQESCRTEVHISPTHHSQLRGILVNETVVLETL